MILEDDTETEIRIRPADNGRTQVELMQGDECLSWLSIVPFTISVGRSRLRMDGIAGVGTDEKHRYKGYSRRVIDAAIEHMARGDAAITMLYGIRDFYPKFGYAGVGPDHIVLLNHLERESPLPAGWQGRGVAPEDIPDLRRVYELNTSTSVGAAVRGEGNIRWSELEEIARGSDEDECRVVTGPDGRVGGYAWLAGWCWYAKYHLPKEFDESFIIAEALADSPDSSDALLAACRMWGREVLEERTVKNVLLAVPPDSLLASAAMYQDARLIEDYSVSGGSMARVLDVGRLIGALKPEIDARLAAVGSDFRGTIRFVTDLGDAAIAIGGGNCSELIVSLPQTELVRLALGAFPPDDILARLPEPPSDEASELLRTIFPRRHPHMYLPDRY